MWGLSQAPCGRDPVFPAADSTLALTLPQLPGDPFTVALLHIKDKYCVRLREMLIAEGDFPPA
jgi:hypothetical protein